MSDMVEMTVLNKHQADAWMSKDYDSPTPYKSCLSKLQRKRKSSEGLNPLEPLLEELRVEDGFNGEVMYLLHDCKLLLDKKHIREAMREDHLINGLLPFIHDAIEQRNQKECLDRATDLKNDLLRLGKLSRGKEGHFRLP